MASWQLGKHTVIMKEEPFLLFLLAIQLFLTQCLETLCMLLAGDYTDISGVTYLVLILAQEMKVSWELKVCLIIVVIDLF